VAVNKISLIGAGVMGEALIAALLKAGQDANSISVIEKRKERCDELVDIYGIKIDDNLDSTDVLLLVIKPQDLSTVLGEISGKLNPNALVISFVAGKKIADISAALSGTNPIVRVMPNTPTLIGQGAAGYSTEPKVSAAQKTFVAQLLNSSGVAIEIEESLQDAVTATSGSGPAYFFAFVEAMIAGSKELGLSEADATKLTAQTFIGAAKLLESSGKSATSLRENVTSPNGTTAAALASFSDSKLNEIVLKAMKAARDRSIELS
jgi:pyrroline-5-carboxylate reductase